MPLDTATLALPRLKGDERLAVLGRAERVWAIGSLYGRYGALMQLHRHLERHLRAHDRVVYLGNYLGPHSLWTGEGIAVIDELIQFRNALIAVPGFFEEDVVHLHGQGEDLLTHIRRLPFQKNHAEWIGKALSFGLEPYISAYGFDAPALETLGHKGLHAMNRWTHQLGQEIGAHKGHQAFFSHLRSAAFTRYQPPQHGTAFIPAGFDPTFALHMQHELLCWPEMDCAEIKNWKGFSRIVRGQGFRSENPKQSAFVLTLDDGLGMKGRLYAACLDGQGHILEWLSF